MGADDYITKPFSPSELMARVDSVYRRVAMNSNQNTQQVPTDKISIAPFELNLRNRALYKNSEQIELTQVEFQIMEYFFSNPGKALSRTDILKHVWGESYYGDEKVVDVNMRRLRMKIEDEPSIPKHLVTVWGMGYKWN
jgi:DNA-binding response OmpR family regulator